MRNRSYEQGWVAQAVRARSAASNAAMWIIQKVGMIAQQPDQLGDRHTGCGQVYGAIEELPGLFGKEQRRLTLGQFGYLG